MIRGNDLTRVCRLGFALSFVVTLVLSFSASVVQAQTPAISLASSASFPATSVGLSSAPQNLVLAIHSGLSINSIAASQSQGSVQEFALGPVADCAVDGVTILNSGTFCTVPITFSPAYPGLRQLPLLLQTSQGAFRFALSGNGQAPKAALLPGAITTAAGSQAGYGGDNGAATNALMNRPSGIAVDGGGNLYIADTMNNRIRQVTAATGVIKTVAGDGSYGNGGDNGLAIHAQLNAPGGVAVDGAGNLYIADSYNYVVREVWAATGIIATVAGNGTQGYGGDNALATNAKLYFPTGVAVDNAGNLYIADAISNRVRMVSASTGVITTVAGNGYGAGQGRGGYTGDKGLATSAELNNPTGVVVDAAGNLFIADNRNSAIRMVAATGGVITTVAGTGVSGYTGAYGPAATAELDNPYGVALDAAGNLYIADAHNNVIRKVDAFSGVITTIAGAGAGGYIGDNGPATAAELDQPYSVTADGAGNLFIADSYNSVIRKVSTAALLAAFPNTNVGSTSAAERVTVSNIGNSPLQFSSIGASSNFSIDLDTTTCSVSSPLPAGGSCNVDVMFAPGTSGALLGALTVTDNSLNAAASTQQVQLSGNQAGGTNTAPADTFSAASLAFGAQTVGSTSAAQQIQLDKYRDSGVDS